MKKEHFPDIMFLMETMNSDLFILKVFSWLGYDYFHTIEPKGKSGGLAIFWKQHLHIDFLFEDKICWIWRYLKVVRDGISLVSMVIQGRISDTCSWKN